MAALSAGSLTYTVVNKRRLGNSKVFNHVNIVLAAGQTYPTGGITITGGNAGCPNTIESFILTDEGTAGYNWNYNTTTGKLQMYYTSAVSAGMTEILNTITPGALSIYVDVVGW